MIVHPGLRPPTASGLDRSIVPVPRPDSMLVLDDGTVWHGWDGPTSDVLAGVVRLRGDQVLLDGTVAITLQAPDVVAFVANLEHPDDGCPARRGCVTPAGATSPVHAAVARAVARRQIGRP